MSSKLSPIKIHCFTDLGKNGIINYLWNVWYVVCNNFHKKGGGDFNYMTRGTVEIIFQMNLGQKMSCLAIAMGGITGLATTVPTNSMFHSSKLARADVFIQDIVGKTLNNRLIHFWMDDFD